MKINYFALFIKKTLRFLLKPLSFVPAIIVAAMIFGFSSQTAVESSAESISVTTAIVHSVNYRLKMNWTPAEQEEKIQQAEFYVRKAAHFTEYLLLAVTLSLPLYVYGVRSRKLFFYTVLICGLYACTDEFHQFFSSGRSPMVLDVCIDTCGAALGTALFHPILWLFRRTVFRPLSLEKEKELKQEYENRRHN